MPPRKPGLWYPVINVHLMKIFIWNIRRGARDDLFEALRGYIRQHRPIVTFFMDTRVDYERALEIVPTLGYPLLPNRLILTPSASSPQVGGYWVLWDAARVDVKLHEATDRIFNFRIIEPRQ